MTDLNERSVLNLEIRSLLASLEQDSTKPRVRAPGRESRQIGLADEIMVTVVTKSGQHGQVIEALRSKKFKVSGAKGILSVMLPVHELRYIEKLPGIESVEIPAELFLPRLNHARSEAGLPAAIQMPIDNDPMALNKKSDSAIRAKPLTGKGVVIATVDSGLDWWHGDFRHLNGKTRIEHYAWWGNEDGSDANDDSAIFRNRRIEPEAEFTEDEINRALNGGQYIRYRDPRGHGTHCMSIAAGNGRASKNFKYQGVAPESTLMALGTERYTVMPVKWAIEKFFELADDRPAVISLSYGSHYGPHDGTSTIEKTIERQSGEGRIVVVAAGNEAEDGIHWKGRLSQDKEIVIPIRIGDDSYQWVEVWIPGDHQVEASVETPDRARYIHSLKDPQETVFGDFRLRQGKQTSGDTSVLLQIYNGRVNHIWRIYIRPIVVKDKKQQIHAWSGTDEPATTAHLFLESPEGDYTVGIPATVEEAIVVGSYVSLPEVTARKGNIKTKLEVGDLSPFSSRGPTRKNLQKPDIVAPGQYITAALASDSVMATAEHYQPRRHETEPYLALQGTSMSTPFVAGVVALMLQRCETLTPKDVRELLTKSARTPQGHPKGEWDRGYGFGILDTKELFKLLECH